MTESELLWDRFCKINFNLWVDRRIAELEYRLKSFKNHVVSHNDWFLLHQITKFELIAMQRVKRLEMDHA